MRRFAIAFSMIGSVFALAACGDAGDHFGEFRPQPQPQNPATVAHVALSLPVKIDPTRDGVYPLGFQGTDGNGFAIAPGINLRNAFTLTSNATCNLEFSYDNTNAKGFTMNFWPKVNFGIIYTKPSKGCKPPKTIVISVYDVDAKPQTSTVKFKSQ